MTGKKKEVKKYNLLKSEKKTWNGEPLFQIQALASFGIVKKGEKGGYIQKEANLSHENGAWVSGNARVYGDAQVSGNAQVYGDAWVYGDAQVSGNAQVYGDAWVSGDAQVSGNAQVYGDAWVSGNAQVYGDAQVSVRANITTKITAEIPRIELASEEDVKKLISFLNKNFKVV